MLIAILLAKPSKRPAALGARPLVARLRTEFMVHRPMLLAKVRRRWGDAMLRATQVPKKLLTLPTHALTVAPGLLQFVLLAMVLAKLPIRRVAGLTVALGRLRFVLLALVFALAPAIHAVHAPLVPAPVLRAVLALLADMVLAPRRILPRS